MLTITDDYGEINPLPFTKEQVANAKRRWSQLGEWLELGAERDRREDREAYAAWQSFPHGWLHLLVNEEKPDDLHRASFLETARDL